MSKFKVGDRVVQVVDGHYHISQVGWKGTVVCSRKPLLRNETYIFVRFDNYPNHDLDVQIEHMDILKKDHIVRKPKNFPKGY